MVFNDETYMDLSELKDSVKRLFPYSTDEFIDDFSELSTGFKFCKLIWTKYNELKFKKFLKNFHLNSDFAPLGKSAGKLLSNIRRSQDFN
jgi:hypothetical protein